MEQAECSGLDPGAVHIAALVDNHAGLVVTVGNASNRRISYRVSVECRIKIQSQASRDLITAFCETHDIAYRTSTDTDATRVTR